MIIRVKKMDWNVKYQKGRPVINFLCALRVQRVAGPANVGPDPDPTNQDEQIPDSIASRHQGKVILQKYEILLVLHNIFHISYFISNCGRFKSSKHA